MGSPGLRLLECFICFEHVKNPLMCPRCSKMACGPCLQSWLASTVNPTCGHCRANVKAFIPCQFVQELQQYDVCQVGLDTCRVHHKLLDYFCHTCDEPVCADCAIVDPKHHQHHFDPINVVYQPYKEAFEKKRNQLDQTMAEYHQLSDQLSHLIMKTKQKEQDVIDFYRSKLLQAITKLSETTQNVMSELAEKKRWTLSQMEACKQTMHQLDAIICTTRPSEMIMNYKTLCDTVKQWMCALDDIKDLPSVIHQLHPLYDSIENEWQPPFECSLFRITDFTAMKKENKVLYSSPFETGGVAWELKVYCGGNAQSKGEYLSVFLQLVNGPTHSQPYEYKFELIPTHPTLTRRFSRSSLSEFSMGECWGFSRFFELDALESGGYWSSETDALELCFHIRPPTYKQLSCDLQARLHKLESSLPQPHNTSVEEGQEALAEYTETIQEYIQEAKRLTCEESEAVSHLPQSDKPVCVLQDMHLDNATSQSDDTLDCIAILFD